MKKTYSGLILRALTRRPARLMNKQVKKLWMKKRSAIERYLTSATILPLGLIFDNCLQAKRTQLERTTAAAHARNKFTFNPQSANAEASSSKLKSPSISKLRKSARRVSFVDGNGEEVSAVLNTPTKGKAKAKRKSRRSHTVLNTSATVSRLKTAEERRVRNNAFYLKLINILTLS